MRITFANYLLIDESKQQRRNKGVLGVQVVSETWKDGFQRLCR